MPRNILKIVAVTVLVLFAGAGAQTITYKQAVKATRCCGLPWCPPGSTCPLK